MDKLADTLRDVGTVYVQRLSAERWEMIVPGLVVLALGLAWAGVSSFTPHPSSFAPTAPRRGRVLSLALLAAAVGLGLLFAWRQRSLVDDAFISFRYARNWVEGHGLVYNPGERVEGYTNFLWVVALAALMRVTRVEPTYLALILVPLSFLGVLAVAYRTGSRLAGRTRIYVPVAVLLLAAHRTFTSFATTGMETMPACLLVAAGAYLLAFREGGRGAFLGGLCLVLATLTRPDHALFFLVGGGVLLGEHAWRSLSRRRGEPNTSFSWKQAIRELSAYAAPLVGYGVYVAWKLHYYGRLLPNTYYAKSGGETYPAQGIVYAVTFLLGSHAWLPLLLFLVWLALPGKNRPAARLSAFAGLSVVLFTTYVVRIGGDFMYGRFFLPLLPPIFLGVESLLVRLTAGARGRWVAAGLAALLAAGAHGLRLIPEDQVRWFLADEGSVYPVTRLRPLTVGHHMFPLARTFRKLHEHGIDTPLAAGGIGMLGYYSRLPIIDLFGLTDARIAAKPLRMRGRPGHEKIADVAYLEERGVVFVRWNVHPRKYAEIALVESETPTYHRWFLLRYDRDLIARVREAAPELQIRDFEAYLNRYIRELDQHPPAEVAADLAWFRRYYFDHNPDPERLAPIEARASGFPGPAPPAPPENH